MQICNSVYSPPFGINKAKKFDYTQNKIHKSKENKNLLNSYKLYLYTAMDTLTFSSQSETRL